MNRELEKTLQNASKENSKVMEECVKKHQNEKKSLREALEIEKEA
jgi:hypothetical protein